MQATIMAVERPISPQTGSSLPEQGRRIDPFLQRAYTIIKQGSMALARDWRVKDASVVHDAHACKDLASAAVRDELQKAGYKTHIFHTIPEVYAIHQHLRIDNPEDPTDPYVVDATWQQFQPVNKHKPSDPDIMMVKLSELEAFLESHGIQGSQPTDPSIDEDSPYYRYFETSSLLDPGHLPWLGATDIETMVDVEW